MLLRLVPQFRRAMDLSLVLDAEGIPHQLRSVGEDHWALVIESDADAVRAESALSSFERENPPPAPPLPRLEPERYGGVLTGLVFGLGLLLWQLWTGPESDHPWFVRGSAEAALILRGEWWRTVTALTLHADAGHAASNALFGGLLLGLLSRRLGTGLACWGMLLAGALGTAAAAELMRQHFASVGASTAVFGALAELAALQAADPASRRRAWVPLGAGVALLGVLGSSKRADLAGHLCGFAAGLLLGLLAARLPPLRSRSGQALLAAGAAVVPALAWLLAFGHLTK